MHPVLMVSSPVPGLLYLNGRSIGEAGGEHAVVVPVAPTGAMYIEHRPLVGGYVPLLRRLTLSGGRVLPGSIAEEPGMSVVLWPGGASELALSPEPLIEMEPVAPEAPIAAENGAARIIEPMNDTVGHVRLRTFTSVDDVLRETQVEYMWSEGGPRWPASPEDTVLAAVEAHLLGLYDEAQGYFTPGAAQMLLSLIPEDVVGCVPLRFASPGGYHAIGLVTLLSSQCAAVSPLYYDALPMGGPQGTWRIQELSTAAAESKQN